MPLCVGESHLLEQYCVQIASSSSSTSISNSLFKVLPRSDENQSLLILRMSKTFGSRSFNKPHVDRPAQEVRAALTCPSRQVIKAFRYSLARVTQGDHISAVLESQTSECRMRTVLAHVVAGQQSSEFPGALRLATIELASA